MDELLNKISDLEREIAALPQGSITVKRIKGKDYYYHRVIKNKKRTETYLPFDQVEELRAQIERRKVLEAVLKKLRKQAPQPEQNELDNPAEFNTIVRTGSTLRSQIAVVQKYKKRECIHQLRD